MSNTYLVTGATGNMGRSVVSTLLSLGHKVHAFTRNPSSKRAQELASSGATMFKGDFLTLSTLSAAAQGCSGVFIISIPGPDDSTNVRNILTTFHESALPDPVAVIVTSIWNNDASTKLMHSPNAGLPSKGPHPFVLGYWQLNDDVEKEVIQSAFQHWTILRPAWYMSNYKDFAVRPIHWPALATEKKLIAGVRPDTLFEMNDPHDIGVFAAHALVEKGQQRWEHKCIDLASEMLTLEEKAAIISRVSGIDVKAVFQEEDEAMKLAEDDFVGYLFYWQKMTAPKVDLDELRKYGFKLGSFEAYLTKHKEELIRALNDDGTPKAGLSTDELLAAAGLEGH